MKGRGTSSLRRALGLLVLICVILAMVGCGGSGGGGGDKDAVALMKKLPQGSEAFMFIDMKAVRTDDDLEDLYEGLEDTTGGMGDMTAMSPDDLDFFVMGDELFIMKGSFDLEEIREYLEDSGLDQDEYQGVETWETFGFGLALDGDTIIYGSSADIEDCIDAIKGKSKSLYDDAKVKDDFAKLPGDALLVIWGAGTQGILGEDEDYEGMEAVVASMSKKDADEMSATVLLRFKDEASAKAAVDQVKEDIEEDSEAEFKNLKVAQDGKYVKVTGEVEIDESLFS